jgi:hypothetical protein
VPDEACPTEWETVNGDQKVAVDSCHDGYDANGDDMIDFANSGGATVASFVPRAPFTAHQRQMQREF